MNGRRCDIHEPPCEGGTLHIKGRHPKGCAQFPDGSWMPVMTCFLPHPEPRRGSQARAVNRWIEDALDR